MSPTKTRATELYHHDWRQNSIVRHIAPFAITGITYLVWVLWPVVHTDPFAIFIAAVIISARFFGFIPALLCTGLSTLTVGFVIFSPALDFRVSHTNVERLIAFIIVSVIAAGLARKRSQAETRAGETRDRMAAIVESSDDAIFSTTSTGTITSWNRGAETLYGYSANEAMGRHIAFLAPIEKAREVAKQLTRIRAGEHVNNFQTEHLRKDGSRVLVQVSIWPLHSGQVIAGASAIVRDITAEKQSEEMLRKNEKLATAGRMAATLAHEINNPLEALGNLLYLARHSPSREEYLRLAEKEVDRISSITRFALGFVRENRAPSLLNVPEMIDEILSLYSAKLASGDIMVKKEYGPGANIEGYPGELRQLFANLLINSADAMKQGGGQLRIHVLREHDRTTPEREGVRIVIADTGCGIRATEMGRLFEPFYTTKQDLGTGLGLWVSQGIVQKHGGRIRVRSRVLPGSSGTVFSIFLPGALQVAPQAVA